MLIYCGYKSIVVNLMALHTQTLFFLYFVRESLLFVLSLLLFLCDELLFPEKVIKFQSKCVKCVLGSFEDEACV